jgi:hypothetical protein
MPQNTSKGKSQWHPFLSAAKFCREYWLFLAPLVGFAGLLVALPNRVSAVEKKQTTQEARQERIEKYVDAQIQQKTILQQLKDNAPDGMVWSEEENRYVKKMSR